MSKLVELLAAVNGGDIEAVRLTLDEDSDLVKARNDEGATALHYAALHGQREIAKELVRRGADINCCDAQYGATPAGWAIEYLRELGGLLAVELEDLAFAVQRGDAAWVRRLLNRFPALRDARDSSGKRFRDLAMEDGNDELAELFRQP